MNRIKRFGVLAFLFLASSLFSQVSVAPYVTSQPQFLDNNGNPLAAGCVFTYAAGTSTNQATYTDSTGSVQNANPIILNAGGFPASGIWLSNLAYKFVVKSFGGSACASGSTIRTEDNITQGNFLNAVTIAGNQTVTGNKTLTGTTVISGPTTLSNVTSLITQKPITDCRWFGTVGNGTVSGTTVSGTDDTNALQACVNYSATNNTRAYIPSAGSGKCYKISHLYLDNLSSRNPGVIINSITYTFPTVDSSHPAVIEMFGDGMDNWLNGQNRTFQKTTFCSTDTTTPAIAVSTNATLPAGQYPYRNYYLHDFNLFENIANGNPNVPMMGLNQLTDNSKLARINLISPGFGSGVIWNNFWGNSGISEVQVQGEQASPIAGTRGIWVYNNDPSAAGASVNYIDRTETKGFDRGTQVGLIKDVTTLFPSTDSVGGTPQLMAAMTMNLPDSESNNYAFVLGYGVQGLAMASGHGEFNKIVGIVVTDGASAIDINGYDAFENSLSDAEINIESTGSPATISIQNSFFQSVKNNCIHAPNLAASGPLYLKNNQWQGNGATTCINTFNPNTSVEDGDLFGGTITIKANDMTAWRKWNPYGTGANNVDIENGARGWTEGSAPTGIAGVDLCYGDSTAHVIKCSFNNGPFQVISAPTLTVKKGSGAGNYTNATTSYTVADSTNLCYTVTIPTGWKLGVQVSGAIGTATAAVVAQAAITDNAACATANAGALVETVATGTAAASGSTGLEPFSLSTVITGDGASHSVAVQFKTSNAADSANLLNGSATNTTTMTFNLTPSN